MLAYAKISGHVQGVGFRFSSKLAALEYGLTGWVKNNKDGTVAMEVAGQAQPVEKYLSAVKAGLNPSIKVDHMDVKREMDSSKSFSAFTIK